MRTFGYLVVGYFLLSFTAMGLVYSSQDPTGLVVFAAGIAAFVWLVRSYRGGKETETIRRDDSARVRTLERRLEAQAQGLEERLPAEPLDLPWMVDLEYAYRDDPAERERVEEHYADTRTRVLECRRELERLRADRRAGPTDAATILADYDRLGQLLAELASTAAALETRAHDAKTLAETAPGEIARAEAALRSARHSSRGVVDPSASCMEDLARAESALRDARAALDERPVRAAELARTAEREALAVEQRIRDVVERPGRVRARADELAAVRKALARDLSLLRDELRSATPGFSRPAAAEVEAAAAAAEAARDEGEAFLAAASDRPRTSDGAATAEDELARAAEAFDRAATLVAGVRNEVQTLVTSAVGARGDVERAEARVDSAWAALQAGSLPQDARARRELVLRRARELAEQARGELDAVSPDWRHASALAGRASELAGDSEVVVPPGEASPALDVETAAERAKAARDEAWAWTLASPDGDVAVRALVEEAEAAYQAAVAAQAAIPAAEGADRDAAAATVAAAFGRAEELSELARVKAAAVRAVERRMRATGKRGVAAEISLSVSAEGTLDS